MRRTVFIGSSSEALEEAKLVSKVLTSVPGITPLLWKKAFPLGALTFEAIESLAHKVVGAVFIVTPDDRALIRKRSVRVPRTNVILEWGYLTAVLGRNRVVICEYEGVSLPADVDGLTSCRMGPFMPNSGIKKITWAAERTLKQWAKDLPSVLGGQPIARVVHGYSGNWKVRIDYKIWRGIELRRNDSVHFDGCLQLVIESDGKKGCGVTYGKVFVSLKDCSAVFRLTDLQVSVHCAHDGSLVLISEPFTRQLNELDGTPPQKDGFEERLPDPNRFEMRLRPTTGGELTGEHLTLRGRRVRSKAVVICERLP